MGMVPDISITFDLNKERKTLEYKRIPFSAWQELKAELKFTPMSLMEAAMQLDLEAFGGIIWLERKQTDRTLRWATVRLELERDDVDFEIVDAGAPDAALEVDPTPAGS